MKNKIETRKQDKNVNVKGGDSSKKKKKKKDKLLNGWRTSINSGIEDAK